MSGGSFTWKDSQRPIVALAPMAGVTDASYRQLIKRIAPEVIVYTEFLSTDALAYGAKKMLEMLSCNLALEKPFIVQVFGHDPDHFLKAALVIEQMGADGIDINMGCPAAKVVSSCHGASLMREPDLAARLVEATKKAVSIPVSVKTRLGWDTKETLIPFCKRLVDAGAQAFAIHGRRFCDKFSGKADWEPIYELKRHVSVPVIGNGDIVSADDAVEQIKNLDGVMVGRGTFGNPWVMREIVDALRGFSLDSFSYFVEDSEQKTKNACQPKLLERRLEQTNNKSAITSVPRTFGEKIPVILEHCELAVQIKGERRGMLEMRRHFISYVKGFDGAREMREKLMRVETFSEAKHILSAH